LFGWGGWAKLASIVATVAALAALWFTNQSLHATSDQYDWLGKRRLLSDLRRPPNSLETAALTFD
jgi:hypothetical protein